MLFVGNGVNRIADPKGKLCGMAELLDKIVQDNSIEKIDRDIIDRMLEKNDFSLCCETVIEESYIANKRPYEDCIEEFLVQLANTKNEDRDNFFKRLYDLKPLSYITTNYDKSFEKSLKLTKKDSEKISKNKQNKGKAIIYHGNFNLEVYHIHGYIQGTDRTTLCLGFRNYTKFMKSFFTNVSTHYSKFISYSEEDLKKRLYKPFYQMLRNDTFIIGFSLASAEIDIWYFLTLRRIIINKNKNIQVGKIYFYEFINEKIKGNKDLAATRRRFLEFYNIELITFAGDKEIYPNKNAEHPNIVFYNKVVDDIEKKVSSN